MSFVNKNSSRGQNRFVIGKTVLHHVILRIRKFSVPNPLMCSARVWGTTSSRGSVWRSGLIRKCAVINFDYVRLSFRHWLKVDLGAAKSIKRPAQPNINWNCWKDLLKKEKNASIDNSNNIVKPFAEFKSLS